MAEVPLWQLAAGDLVLQLSVPEGEHQGEHQGEAAGTFMCVVMIEHGE